MHEHIQESLLLGRRTKGNFACCFRLFLQFSNGAFWRHSPISTGRNDPLTSTIISCSTHISSVSGLCTQF